MRSINKPRLLEVAHFILWLIWAVSLFFWYERRTADCFRRLFGRYIGFKTFEWGELIFMFGGWWVLLALLVSWRWMNRYVAYAIFELVFLGVIGIHFWAYFGCRG